MRDGHEAPAIPDTFAIAVHNFATFLRIADRKGTGPSPAS